jgi:hypothetical protein
MNARTRGGIQQSHPVRHNDFLVVRKESYSMFIAGSGFYSFFLGIQSFFPLT